MSDRSVGFVGVGAMGAPMARYCIASGYVVSGHDVSQSAINSLLEMGARTASSPRELAMDSDVTILMVQTDHQARDVVLGSDGVLAGARPDSILMICSSLRPSTVKSLSQTARERGVKVVDAPVNGGVPAAEAGNLVFLVGGEDADVERCQPLFSAMGSAAFHVGEVGAGQIAKLANNLMLWGSLVTAAEALTLAKSLSADIPRLRRALEQSSGASWALQHWDQLKVLTWANKDLEIINELAIAEGIDAPLAASLRNIMSAFEMPQL